MCVFIMLSQAYAQSTDAYLDVQVATHQYHGDGVESEDATAVEKNTNVEEKISPIKWLKLHIPEIFSQDYVNYATHDQSVSKYFIDSGRSDYQLWQKRQVALLIRHQFIVKATLSDETDIHTDGLNPNAYVFPIKLMFHGYDRHFAKKIEIVNITVSLNLKPDPKQNWVISKLSVEVNDDKEKNQKLT